MDNKKLPAIILLSSIITGIAFSQNVDRTINEVLQRFYETNNLHGGISVAISRNGRLVYAGSVGYADSRNTIRLTPEHRMRTASVSKPITRIAILNLQNEGKLRLNDFVFGSNGVFKGQHGLPVLNGQPTDITIRNLVEHRSGGWSNITNYGISNRQQMRQRIENIPLINEPGTVYAYSNLGYNILALVIEEVTGMPYENYVKEHVLLPAGIDGMRLGTNRLGNDEPEYLDSRGRITNINPSNSPGSGGWIAQPVELLKFMRHWDRYLVSNFNFSGSSTSTYSWIAKRSGGFNVVILANHRPPAPRYSRVALFDEIRAAVSVWPTGTDF